MSENKYINFSEPRASATGITQIWDVVSVHSGDVLGVVSWFGRWRRYAFFPADGTVYEHGCMRTLADFCEEQTQCRKS